MKRILITGIFLCCFSIEHIKAQKVDTDSLIDSIKANITSFFIKQGLLDARKEKTINYVFATEINQKRSIGYDSIGIYRIGIYQSHSPEYILVKQKNKFEIFEFDKISLLLKRIIDYSEENHISDKGLSLYISKVLDIYMNNNYSGVSKIKKVAK
jgi:hypothetical protein